MYVCPQLLVHLSLLFTAMLRHSFVPEDFRLGIIKPILKSKHGNSTSLDMYRGITLTPSLSKLFERTLMAAYGHFLCSDNLQFGFKRGNSCSHALFTFSESVRYFNKMEVKYTVPFYGR